VRRIWPLPGGGDAAMVGISSRKDSSMKAIKSMLCAAAAAMLLSGAARAQNVTLKVGDAAPALPKGEWIKGEKTESFEKGKVYVIECWATWCGPCIAAIPHVTELQQKYGDQGLKVIGLNVWERQEGLAKPFVEKQGDRMGYAVLLDTPVGEEGYAAKNWLEAAGQNGIPCSFVIDKEGKIAWIGHPMSMEPVLKKVIAGTFDAKAEAASAEKMQEAQQKFVQAMQAGKTDEALKILDDLAASSPEMAPQLMSTKLRVLLSAGREDDAMKVAREITEKSEDAQALNAVAWTIVDPESEIKNKDLDVAMKAATKANELSGNKESAILDTLARVYFVKGDKAKAIEYQTKAVEHAEAGEKAELQKTLDEYKK
jgi:thiol-disulfide isomerase/thioredoxin